MYCAAFACPPTRTSGERNGVHVARPTVSKSTCPRELSATGSMKRNCALSVPTGEKTRRGDESWRAYRKILVWSRSRLELPSELTLPRTAVPQIPVGGNEFSLPIPPPASPDGSSKGRNEVRGCEVLWFRSAPLTRDRGHLLCWPCPRLQAVGASRLEHPAKERAILVDGAGVADARSNVECAAVAVLHPHVDLGAVLARAKRLARERRFRRVPGKPGGSECRDILGVEERVVRLVVVTTPPAGDAIVLGAAQGLQEMNTRGLRPLVRAR